MTAADGGSLDGIVLEVIAVTLQLFGFLDTGLTLLAFTAALSVVMVVAGLVGVAWSRVRYAYKRIPGLVDAALDEQDGAQ